MARLQRIFHRIRAYWTGSISRQLGLGFGFLSMLLLGLSGYLLYDHQRDFLYAQGQRAAGDLAYSLAVSSSSWVLARDMAGLQEVTSGYATTPDLKFAVVLSRRGEVLASTRPEHLGHYFVDALSQSLQSAPAEMQVLISNNALVDVAVPIMAGLRHIGWARIEMRQASANRHLREMIWGAVGFMLFATLLVVLVAIKLGRRLRARLQRLVQVANAVEQGNHRLRAQLSGPDEIGVLGRGMDRMLDALQAQQLTMTMRHAELTMYNHVLQQISEGIALPAAMQALAWEIEALHPRSRCAIFEKDGAVLRLLAGSSLPEPLHQRVSNLDIASSQGSSAQAARSGAVVISPDVRVAPIWTAQEGLAQDLNIAACWSQPILGPDRTVLGVFTLYREERGSPDAAQTEVLARCASLAGLAIQRRRQENDLRLAAVAFESQEAMVVLDAQHAFVRVNQAFLRMFGYTEAELLGQSTTSKIRSSRYDEAFMAELWTQLQRDGVWQGEIWHRRKNGEEFPSWLHATQVKDALGQTVYFVLTCEDITKRKAAEAEIRQLAFYDPLTGLPNRRMLLDQLRHVLASSRRGVWTGALLFVDLDNFKSLNDTLGHDKGDLLLQEVGRRLLQNVRESDVVARLGGDEFVVLLTHLANDPLSAANEAKHVASKLLNALHARYELDGVQHHNSGSIGVTLFSDEACTVDALFKQADLALHEAKAMGRDTYCFFDPAMQARISERVALEQDLRGAMQSQQFMLHYQAQVDGIGQVRGAEVLLRWQHPARGMVSPAIFIPLAEETGLIMPLGRWVLQQACQQLASWSASAQTAQWTLSVNVSMRQLQAPDFVQQVLSALLDSAANPARLKLELTESLLLQNVEDTIGKMQALKAHGVGFSLDDFGTGYSSLSYLSRLPLDQLKIDQSFVRDALVDKGAAAIIQAIVGLGQSLQLQVIAEGVETWEQRDFLAQQGCHACQGYLFGRPGPVESLRTLAAPAKPATPV